MFKFRKNGKTNDTADKPAGIKINYVEYDELEAESVYEVGGIVKAYRENVLDKKPDQMMGFIESSRPFKGKFKILDFDGGIGDIPIWYQAEVIKNSEGSGIDNGEVVWLNSFSLKRVKVRKISV